MIVAARVNTSVRALSLCDGIDSPDDRLSLRVGLSRPHIELMRRRRKADTAAEGERKGLHGGNPEEPPQAVRVLMAVQMRLREYLLVATVQYPILIRPFTRWYFDLLKNALVIAAVSYFAEKTKSKALHLIAEFSLIIFLLYCITYLYAWEPWLMNRVKSPIWRRLLILLLMPVTAGVIFVAFNHTLHLVMKALRRAQLP
jgi:hypothetical protein